MEIKVDDLTGPEVAQLLQEHLDEMAQYSPPESRHALDLSGLQKPEITFWGVWEGNELVGCGALKEMDPQHGEIKSMRVTYAHRGRGIGRKMLIRRFGFLQTDNIGITIFNNPQNMIDPQAHGIDVPG